jgi:heptaprenyl diphosphate synthase
VSHSQATLAELGPDPFVRARALVDADLRRFDELLESTLDKQREYLSESEYELYRRGKRLRPLLLLLSARMAGPPREAALADKIISAAVSLEMLHVATLIHDDIVDAAPLRRGLPTVHGARGTESAVLIGDMQFIQAVRCFAQQVETDEDLRLVRLVLDVGFEICCGELDELQTDPRLDVKALHERYLRTIERKTAMMFGLACECGASLAGGGRRAIFYLSQFGRLFGRAFQIMDDVLDFLQPESESGKARGLDLEQGRLSMPIIHALAEPGPEPLLRHILLHGPDSPAQLDEGVRAVLGSRGIVKSYAEARAMVLEANAFLAGFPAGPHREALTALADYIVERGADTADRNL